MNLATRSNGSLSAHGSGGHNLNPSCRRAALPPGAPGEGPSCPSSQLGCQCSWVCSHVALPLPPFVSVSQAPLCLPLRTSAIGVRATSIQILTFITSAKTLFPTEGPC